MSWPPSLTALRLSLAVAGFLLGLAGIALDRRPVIWVAIGALAGSFVVRLLQRRRHDLSPGGD